MEIKTRIKTVAMEMAGEQRVRDVRMGLGYSAVQLDSGPVGLAYNFLDGIEGGCSVYEGPRPLAGRKASELLDLFDRLSPLDSALALACANALLNRPDNAYTPGASITQLNFKDSDRVGMVGHFAPFVNKIRPQVASIEIFERQPRPEQGILGFEQAVDILPACDVALVTSTCIINNTINQVLKLLDQCREVVMLGTSTPMSQQAFAGTPVTLLSGITVTDVSGVLRAVSEAGGTPDIRRYTEKVNLRIHPRIEVDS